MWDAPWCVLACYREAHIAIVPGFFVGNEASFAINDLVC